MAVPRARVDLCTCFQKISLVEMALWELRYVGGQIRDFTYADTGHDRR